MASDDPFLDWLDEPYREPREPDNSVDYQTFDRLYWGTSISTTAALVGTDAWCHIGAAPTDERPIVIAPFVRQGDTVFLVGERGQGKSTLTADLVWAVGQACMNPDPADVDIEVGAGVFRVTPELFFGGTIAILDGENEPRDWASFLTSTAAARGYSATDPRLANLINDRLFHLDGYRWPLCPQAHPTQHENAREQLVELLIAHDTRLLVIDPLAAIYGRANIEKQEWVRQGLEVLRHDLRRAGITIWILAHPSRYYPDKPNQNKFMPAGTSAQEGMADVVIGIWQPPAHRDELLIQLRLEKRRAGKWNQVMSKALLRGTPLDGGYASCRSEWTFEDTRVRSVPVLLTEAERRTLFACPPYDAWSYDLVAERMESDRSRVSRVVRQVFLLHELVEKIGGSGKKGDPIFYALTDKGRALRSELLTQQEAADAAKQEDF